MKKKLLVPGLIALVVSAYTGCPPTPSTVNPGTYYLSVGLIPQTQAQWCWAASAQMVMAYHGKSVSQCEQAQHHGDRNPGLIGSGTICCAQPPPQDCNNPGTPDFGFYGFAAQQSFDPLGIEQIKEQIFTKQIPFVFSLSQQNDKHFRVAKGYKTLLVAPAAGYQQRPIAAPPVPRSHLYFFIYVNDPEPLNTGSIWFVPYGVYSTPGVHQETYFDITPEKQRR